MKKRPSPLPIAFTPKELDAVRAACTFMQTHGLSGVRRMSALRRALVKLDTANRRLQLDRVLAEVE